MLLASLSPDIDERWTSVYLPRWLALFFNLRHRGPGRTFTTQTLSLTDDPGEAKTS